MHRFAPRLPASTPRASTWAPKRTTCTGCASGSTSMPSRASCHVISGSPLTGSTHADVG